MLLAFKLSDIITVPFGWLLSILYDLTTNYGVALILFSVLVKLILLPMTAKGKKSMMKMARLTPRVKALQDKYADDQAKQSQAIQDLYKSEHVSMFGGCLWSFVPILILFPLYNVIRHPIVYMLHESMENAELIVGAIREAAPELIGANTYYAEMNAAHLIPKFVEEIRAVLPNVSDATLAGVNFSFLGLDLGKIPQFNIFGWDAYNWANIGLFLIPLLSAGSQVLATFISNRMNNSVITDKNGVQDEEAAKESDQAKSGKVMMWMMPIMSLWIGFTVCAALSLYWLASGVISILADVLLTSHYRKIYDAEDAVRLKKAMEEEAAESEKERIRAERRAANPDGITANTSKKKIQKQQQQAADAAKAAAAKEYAAKKGIVQEQGQASAGEQPLSGIAERPNCKGRAYNPNRYGTHKTEE